MARRARHDVARKKLNQKLNQNRQEGTQPELSGSPPRVCYASFVHRLCSLLTIHTLCALGLFAAVTAAAQQVPSGQKTIQDKAEYAAYTAATNTQDATARAEALEAFVQQYPKSVVLTDALEEEMAAWQTAGDSKQVMKVAKRLLAADQSNIRALGIVVALDRMNAAAGDNASLNEMCQLPHPGGMLAVPMWRQPANMSPVDYNSLSKLLSDIFIGAEGYCAVQEKNYSQARDWLQRALKMDSTNVQDTYQLAVADLESTPVDANGFWYCARGIYLAESSRRSSGCVASMTAYCKAKYTKVHGADDGWDTLLASVADEDTPPSDFAAKIKPAPAAQAPQK